MKYRILGFLVIAAGLALTVLWFIRDPGWTAVFGHSAIIIGFIPIPGALFGGLLQLFPALIGLIAGSGLRMRGEKEQK